MTAELEDIVARIDLATRRIVARIPVGRAPAGIAFGADALWVTSPIDRTVTSIDPAQNRVVATIRMASSPQSVAAGDGALWLAADAG